MSRRGGDAGAKGEPPCGDPTASLAPSLSPSLPPSHSYERYAGDPAGFVREVLGGRPWGKQIEILEAVRDFPRVTVRSSHGIGKTWIAAACVNYFLHCFRPAIVLTTAPTHRQVTEVLWRQIRQQRARAARLHGVALPGRCLQAGITLDEETFALGLTTDEPERFQGFHSPNILVVVDEASGVPEPIFEAIDGILTTRNARLLLIGNPTQLSGTFYRSHHSAPGWHRIHISAFDSPNLEEGEKGRRGEGESRQAVDGLLPGSPSPLLPFSPSPSPHWELTDADLASLVTPEWVEQRRQEWGEASPIYEIRVLGQFPTQGTDTLIPLAWIDRASGTEGEKGRRGEGESRQRPDAPLSGSPSPLLPFSPSVPDGCVEIGVDVARFGDCENVAYVRRGPVVVAEEVWRGCDLMGTTGRVAALIRAWQPAAVKIDSIGMGAGVVDRLREQGFRQVIAVNVALPATDREQYASLRDEIYFALQARFRDGNIVLAPLAAGIEEEKGRRGEGECRQAADGLLPGSPSPLLSFSSSIPGADDKLRSQLAALKYAFASTGQQKVESKDDMRRRGLPSPDRADALALCFAPVRRNPWAPVAFSRSRY